MRFLGTASNIKIASVRYEHGGKFYVAYGQSVGEIKRRILEGIEADCLVGEIEPSQETEDSGFDNTNEQEEVLSDGQEIESDGDE